MDTDIFITTEEKNLEQNIYIGNILKNLNSQRDFKIFIAILCKITDDILFNSKQEKDIYLYKAIEIFLNELEVISENYELSLNAYKDIQLYKIKKQKGELLL